MKEFFEKKPTPEELFQFIVDIIKNTEDDALEPTEPTSSEDVEPEMPAVG